MEKNGSPPSVLVIIAASNEEEGIGPSLAELKEVLKRSNILLFEIFQFHSYGGDVFACE